MALDFEALVGHLYVVGNRSLSAQPPGMLVEVAPKKAARGRELDTFFALVTPSGENTAPAAFYDQMANISAERYFNSSGSVTAGLRAVFSSLNQDLNEHNQSGKRPYEANLICAVLRDDELILARSGSGVALFRDGETLVMFPTEFENEDALFGPPLGIQPVPDIKMSRQTVTQGARLILSDANLADMDISKVKTSLATGDISDVLSGLKEISVSLVTLMVIEFVPPEAPSPDTVKDTRSSSRAPEAAAPVPAGSAPSAAATGSGATSSARPPRQPRGLPRSVERGSGKAALLLSGAFSGANRLFDRIIPPPEAEGRGWLRASTATGIAVLIPIAIVLLVLAMGVGGTGQSEFELCVENAGETAAIARGIASSDVQGTLAAWNAVLSVVDRCNAIRAGDPAMTALTNEAQVVIDALFLVERRATRLVASFNNAALTQVVLQGLDLYALDAQNQLVYRVSLPQDGRPAAPSSGEPIPSMRLGAVIGQFQIGELIDIAWSETTTQIMALDRNGVLIQCSPRFLQSCDGQQLLASERWVGPTRMVLWQGRIYLLDPGANQVWRYDSSGGVYATSPIEYFAGENRPDITTAVDFGIDDNGIVYVLTQNGQMTKWVSGQPTPFAYANFPEGQQLTDATAMFLNADPIAQGLYLVSRSSRTIYETTLAGTWSYSYRAANEDDFAGLSNVVADPSNQVIYALSGNSIFAFDRVETEAQ
ncbi:MAG: hypothetical protein JNJ61_31155 [Anaerolineae bacterium]|nr:hypothetical protein [Anaerolineae bacterium]